LQFVFHYHLRLTRSNHGILLLTTNLPNGQINPNHLHKPASSSPNRSGLSSTLCFRSVPPVCRSKYRRRNGNVPLPAPAVSGVLAPLATMRGVPSPDIGEMVPEGGTGMLMSSGDFGMRCAGKPGMWMRWARLE